MENLQQAQTQQSDNVSVVYDALKSEGYDVPESIEDFKEKLKKPENLKVIYDALNSENYALPAFDEFKAKMAKDLVSDEEKRTMFSGVFEKVKEGLGLSDETPPAQSKATLPSDLTPPSLKPEENIPKPVSTPPISTETKVEYPEGNKEYEQKIAARDELALKGMELLGKHPDVTKYLPKHLSEKYPESVKYAYGAVLGGLDKVQEVITPENVALIAAFGGLPTLVKSAVGMLLGGQMGLSAYQSFKEALKGGKPEDVGRNVAGGIVDLLFGLTAAGYGGKEGKLEIEKWWTDKKLQKEAAEKLAKIVENQNIWSDLLKDEHVDEVMSTLYQGLEKAPSEEVVKGLSESQEKLTEAFKTASHNFAVDNWEDLGKNELELLKGQLLEQEEVSKLVRRSRNVLKRLPTKFEVLRDLKKFQDESGKASSDAPWIRLAGEFMKEINFTEDAKFYIREVEPEVLEKFNTAVTFIAWKYPYILEDLMKELPINVVTDFWIEFGNLVTREKNGKRFPSEVNFNVTREADDLRKWFNKYDLTAQDFITTIVHEYRHLNQFRGGMSESEFKRMFGGEKYFKGGEDYYNAKGEQEARAAGSQAVREYLKTWFSAGKALLSALLDVDESMIGGSIIPLIPFTEESWLKAKPHLLELWEANKKLGRDFGRFYENMVETFGEGITPFLDKMREDLKHTDALVDSEPTPSINVKLKGDVVSDADKKLSDVVSKAKPEEAGKKAEDVAKAKKVLAEDTFPNAKTVDAITGDHIPERQVQDINPLSAKVHSPEWELLHNGFTEAADLSGRIVEADALASLNVSKHRIFFESKKRRFRDLFGLSGKDRLSKEEQIAVRDAMETLFHLRNQGQEERARALIETNKVYRAADELISWFEHMKYRYRAYLARMQAIELSPEMNQAIADLIKEPSASIEEVARHRGVDVEELRREIAKYDEISKWGLKDFYTKIEKGMFKVVRRMTNADGKSEWHIISAKETRAKAEKELSFFKKENPDWDLRIEFRPESPDPFSPRKDVLSGEENIFDALMTYAYRAEKKMALDPIEAEMKREFRIDDERDVTERRYPTNVRNLLYKQLRGARGSYWIEDKIANHILNAWASPDAPKVVKALGLHTIARRTKPQIASRWSGKIRMGIGALKLGYRVSSYVVNTFWGYGHIFVKLGTKWMREGRDFLKTEEGKKFIENNEHLLGMTFVGEAGGKFHTNLPWWHPLKVFGMSEPAIRKLNLASAYKYFLSEGHTAEEATFLAGRSVRFWNFVYDTAAIPEIMRSPGAKVVTQFKTYLVKEIEFVRDLSPQEFLRYAGLQLMFAGPRGALLLLKSIPILGALGLLDNLEEKMKKLRVKHVPLIGTLKADYGLVGSLLGVDITAAATVQLANRAEDVAGVFFSDAISFFKRVALPLLGGEKFVIEDAKDWMLSLSPIVRKWNQAIQAVLNKDGWVRDRNGNKLFQVTSTADLIKLSLGVTPLEMSDVSNKVRLLKREQAKTKNSLNRLSKRLIKKINVAAGDETVALVLTRALQKVSKKEDLPLPFIQSLADYARASGRLTRKDEEDIALFGLNLQAFQNRFDFAQLPPEQRALLKTRLLERARAAGLLFDGE